MIKIELYYKLKGDTTKITRDDLKLKNHTDIFIFIYDLHMNFCIAKTEFKNLSNERKRTEEKWQINNWMFECNYEMVIRIEKQMIL